MKKNITINSDYLYNVYHVDRFIDLVSRSVESIKNFRKKNKFDAIAFTGTSGAALAYPLSYRLKVPLICVRKSAVDNHFGSKLEGAIEANRYIIVDDFIDSGKTVNRIKRAIKQRNPDSKLIGIFLYSDHREIAPDGTLCIPIKPKD